MRDREQTCNNLVGPISCARGVMRESFVPSRYLINVLSKCLQNEQNKLVFSHSLIRILRMQLMSCAFSSFVLLMLSLSFSFFNVLV